MVLLNSGFAPQATFDREESQATDAERTVQAHKSQEEVGAGRKGN